MSMISIMMKLTDDEKKEVATIGNEIFKDVIRPLLGDNIGKKIYEDDIEKEVEKHVKNKKFVKPVTQHITKKAVNDGVFEPQPYEKIMKRIKEMIR